MFSSIKSVYYRIMHFNLSREICETGQNVTKVIARRVIDSEDISIIYYYHYETAYKLLSAHKIQIKLLSPNEEEDTDEEDDEN